MIGRYKSLIVASLLLSSCTQIQGKECQFIGELGFQNEPSCSFGAETNRIQYNALGLVDGGASSARTDYKILLLGDELVSGEFLRPEERISAILERRLARLTGKRISVVNAGIRNATTMQMALKYRDVLNTHQPNLTVLVFRGPAQLARDYFRFENLLNFCPAIKILNLNRSDIFPVLFGNTRNSIANIGSLSRLRGVETAFFWVGGGVLYEKLLNQVPGCDLAKRFTRKKRLSILELQDYLASAEIPLVASSSFSTPFIEAQNSEPELSRVRYVELLADALVPWILPKL